MSRKLRHMLIGGVFVTGTLGFAGHAFAQAVESADDSRPLLNVIRRHVLRWQQVRDVVGITPEQKEGIQKTLAPHRPELAGLMKRIVTSRHALREAVVTGADEATIRATSAELGTAIADAAVLTSRIVPEIKKILTPEQVEAIQATRLESQADTLATLDGMMK